MSLIDGLIDELNKSADEWNESNMFELARMCRNAAYTISELRNDAELLRRMWRQERTEKQCYMAENAKLRELVKSMYYDLTNMTFPPDWVTDYEADMRELGVDE